MGNIFPSINKIWDVSKTAAMAVMEKAIRDRQASKLREKDIANLDAFVASKIYALVYVPLVERF